MRRTRGAISVSFGYERTPTVIELGTVPWLNLRDELHGRAGVRRHDHGAGELSFIHELLPDLGHPVDPEVRDAGPAIARMGRRLDGASRAGYRKAASVEVISLDALWTEDSAFAAILLAAGLLRHETTR